MEIFAGVTLKNKLINMSYVMHLLSRFHLPKPDQAGEKCLHREACWHRSCGLSCFVVPPDQIPLRSVSPPAKPKQQQKPNNNNNQPKKDPKLFWRGCLECGIIFSNSRTNLLSTFPIPNLWDSLKEGMNSVRILGRVFLFPPAWKKNFLGGGGEVWREGRIFLKAFFFCLF